MELYLIKNNKGHYLPAYESDWEKSKKVPSGELVKGNYKKERNYKFLKKYWALIRMTYHNLPEKLDGFFPNEDALHDEIKMQLGYREQRESLGGKVYFIPGSIAFDKMDENEFEEFYGRAFDLICKIILTGSNRADLEQELVNYM